MTKLDLSEWPEIATSGIRSTMIDGGKYRDQKMTVHRHADGRLLILGRITVDDVVVKEQHQESSAAGVESTARAVAGDLGMDHYILDSCITAYRRLRA